MVTVNSFDKFWDTLREEISKENNCSVKLIINDTSKIEGLYRYSSDYERSGFAELLVYYYEKKEGFTPTKTFSVKGSVRKNISVGNVDTLIKKVEKFLNQS